MSTSPLDVPARQARDLQLAWARFWRYSAVQRAEGQAYAALGYPGRINDPVVPLIAATDALMIGLARTFARDVDGHRRATIAAEVQETLDLHEARGWPADPAAYHTTPIVPSPKSVARKGSWEVLTHESSYTVPDGEPGASRWLARTANRTAVLRVRRIHADAPWLVLIHGAGMGQLRIDAGMFDADRLGDTLGVNIVMPVLPLHGPRRTAGPTTNSVLPLVDTVDTLHGLTQAVHDVRSAMAWARNQGDRPISVYGYSLGGFTAAAVSALEPELGAVVALMPLVDATDVMTSKIAHRQRRAEWFESYHEAGSRLLSVTSPLALPVPATPSRRMTIIAGRADRFVAPREHAVRLAAHWGGAPVQWLRASHMSHVRSARLRELVEGALAPPD